MKAICFDVKGSLANANRDACCEILESLDSRSTGVYKMLQANEASLFSGRRLAFCVAFPLGGSRVAAREHAKRMKCCDFLAGG